MIIIGVTGITGSGKTVVTRILSELGGLPIETDTLAHRLMKKGQPVYDEIIAAFGPDILDGEGEIHRKALGKLVFNDKVKMSRLESIIHPKVAEETAKIIAEAKKTGKYKFAIIDAPLLIEAGMHKNCDSTWLITADNAIRCTRIIERDNISKEYAEKRLNSRKGDESLKPYADIVIENNDGTIAPLKQKVIAALESVQT